MRKDSLEKLKQQDTSKQDKHRKTMKSLCKELKEQAPQIEQRVKDKKAPLRAKEEQKTMDEL